MHMHNYLPITLIAASTHTYLVFRYGAGQCVFDTNDLTIGQALEADADQQDAVPIYLC